MFLKLICCISAFHLLQIIFKEISEAKWPDPQAAGGLICRHNGSVKVTSLDGHACLCLSELQQEFTVEFLCKVSQKPTVLEKSCSESTKGWCERSSQTLTLGQTSKQLSTEGDDKGVCRNPEACMPVNKSESSSNQTEGDRVSWSFQSCSSEYSVVTQHMSVSCLPEEWKYPFSLASTFFQSLATEQKGSKDGGNVGQVECKKSRMVTCLPSALPLNCCAPYLHRYLYILKTS